MKNEYYYKLYGLTVKSEVPIPQALSITTENEILKPDVEVVLGQVPLPLQEVGEKGYGSWIKGFEAAWFNTKGTAQYFISGGNKIVIHPYDNPNEKLMISMILSAGMSLILLQRNDPVLHGSVIEKAGYAYIICGNSGAGKSTVTMDLLEDKDVMFMADDTVRLVIENGMVFCHPTYPQQKVCRDLACRMGLDLNTMVYIDEGRDKFALKRHDKYYDRTAPLKAIFILNKDNETKKVNSKQIRGINYVYEVIDNLYLADNYKRDIGVPHEFMEFINFMYKQVDIYQITRPIEGNTVREVADMIRFLQSC